jgi:phosphoglycerate kinase
MFHFDGILRLQELDVTRRKVLVRADLDAPVEGTVASVSGTSEANDQNTAAELATAPAEYNKVSALAATVQYLLQQEALVQIAAHCSLSGAWLPDASLPDAEPPSLEAHAAQLAGVLGIEVYMPDEINGPIARKLLKELRHDRVLMYENLALQAGEAAGDEGFARQLADNVEVYVGDCLVAMTDYASLKLVPRLCHERGMGVNLERELLAFNRISRSPTERTVLFVGGRFAQRSELLARMLRPKLTICAGGTLAATLLAAKNSNIGGTPHETEWLGEARTFLAHARDAGTDVILPKDARTSHDSASTPLASLTRQQLMLDVGDATLRSFVEQLSGAHSVVMLDALSMLDARRREAQRSTAALLSEIANCAAYSVVCSSANLPISHFLSTEQSARIGFISTAGQGFADALCGRMLGAVEVLRTR